MKIGSRKSKPAFFKTPLDFRAWLQRHHLTESELVVGFYKVSTGKASITWPQSVDEALSFGWIDGIRRTIDDGAYTIRFTPRKATSIWSAVNVKRMKELIAEGRVSEAGHRAFAKRDEKQSEIYSYERKNAELGPELQKTFKVDKKAWAFYEKQAPSYRRVSAHWVASAKQEETRVRRLERLMECSRLGKRIDQLTSPARRTNGERPD